MIRRDIYDGPPLGYNSTGYRKRYVAIHNTSNDATAQQEADYAKRRTDKISCHYYADPTEVIQSLDTALGANHAGSTEGNRYAIAWEVTGTNGKSRAWWLANLRWDLMAPVMAADCREYGIEPRLLTVAEMRAGTAKGFVTHDLMRLAWGGTTHTDPGPNFPMDHLLALVRAELEDDVAFKDDPNAVALIWRVLAILRNDAEAKFTLPGAAKATVERNELHFALGGLGDRLTALESRPPVEAAPVDPAVLKALLLDPEVVAVYAKAAAAEVHADLAD